MERTPNWHNDKRRKRWKRDDTLRQFWRQEEKRRRRSVRLRKRSRARARVPHKQGPLTLEDAQLYLSGRGPNPRFRPTPAEHGSVTVTLPAIANFSDRQEETLIAIERIREAALFSNKYELRVDLHDLESISPAAAVVLVAELQRCLRLMRGSQRGLKGRWPREEFDSSKVLAGLGAASLLDVPEPTTVESDESRAWFKIISKDVVPTQEIDELILHYRQFIAIDRVWRSKFYRALGDAASNVIEHAYPGKTSEPHLLRRWWMAGIVDGSNSTINFVFWDQGVGIPTTMRQRRLRRIHGSSPKADAKLIRLATTVGESRHRNKRRGHGLRALIELIDLAPGGVLRICSGQGIYEYQKGKPHQRDILARPVGGTLIVWSIGV